MSENSATMFPMLSERGFKLLVFEGFKFAKNRRTQCGQKWRCTNRKCSAHLFTDDNGDELIEAVGVHNHEPCPNLHRQCISNSVKRKAAETLTESPAKVITKEIVSVGLPENISGKVTKNDMDRIRRNLNYAKRSKVPPLPRCIVDVIESLDSIPIKTTQETSIIMSGQKISHNIGFLGAGNMAKAIAFGLIESGLLNSPSQITATAPSMSNLEEWKEKGCNVSQRNADLMEDHISIIFLAVKPQYAKVAIESLFDIDSIPSDKCLVSIMVGITTLQLKQMVGFAYERAFNRKYTPQEIEIMRTMPNTPLLVGEGCTVFCYSGCRPKHLDTVKSILSVNGFCEEVDEKLMNPIGALSGSGPAYVYQMIEALSDGGVKLGIPRPLAIKLAAKTLMGGAKMVLETGKHPGQLKDEVCSPGGSTIAGISAMERQGVRFGLISAIEAAYLRSNEISKANS